MNPLPKADGECPVKVQSGSTTLDGDLCLPRDARGVVAFAHGSGSSRLSPRNRYVAGELRRAGLGTLLFDLLTPDEEREDEQTARLRFDIGLLARRLVGATDWLAGNPAVKNLGIGYFGASTGAAAAIVAAAERPEWVGAVVSRGGRVDLAGEALGRVKAPSLFIVGGYDETILVINSRAIEKVRAEKELVIVPKASHLFEEPGTLEQAARLATRWFLDHLKKRPAR